MDLMWASGAGGKRPGGSGRWVLLPFDRTRLADRRGSLKDAVDEVTRVARSLLEETGR